MNKVWFFLFAALLAANMCQAWEIRVRPQKPPIDNSEVYSDQGLEIRDGSEELACFWSMKLTERQPGAAHERVAFPVLKTGEILGVISFQHSWTDYRGQSIREGTYVLRYAIQPLLKDHIGVSEWRDFALLVRPDQRNGPNLLEASRAVSGTSHPAVVSLLPVSEAHVPGIHKNERNEMVLEVTAVGVSLGIVLEGQGKIGEL